MGSNRGFDPISPLATTVPAVGRSIAIRAGQSRRIGALSDSTTSTIVNQTPATRRTDFGLMEVSGEPASVVVSIFFNAQALLEAIIGSQRDSKYGDLENVQIRFDVVSATGAVVVYATSVDNGTGDSIVRIE